MHRGKSAILVLMMSTCTVNAAVKSETEACTMLTDAAKKKHLSAMEDPEGKYYCWLYSTSKKYFVFQLHYHFDVPRDWVGSDLVGYYAVRKNDAAIFEWNLGDDSLGKNLNKFKVRQ
jgi:hypothetical protein